MLVNNELTTVNEILFDKAVAQLNLETLSKTAQHTLVSGNMPMSRPVQHSDFILWMQQELRDRTGRDILQEPIYVSARHAQRIKTSPDEIIDPKAPFPVDRLHIERLVTRVGIQSSVQSGDDKLNPAFAISYHDRGIEVAFGTNVWACANMNIFGSKRYATYGTGKVDFQAMKELIKVAMSEWQGNFEQDVQTIQELKSVELPYEKELEYMGELYRSAVHANVRRKKDWILNQGQCNNLQAELIKRRELAEKDDRPMTHWDFTQASTEWLKATTSAQDLSTLYSSVQTINDFVVAKARI